MSQIETFDDITKTLTVTGTSETLNKLTKEKSTAKIIDIKNGFKIIAYNCFDNYSLVEEIKLPETIEIIGDNIIKNMPLLKTLFLPRNVRELHELQSFDNAFDIENIEVDSNNQYFCDVDGVLFSKDMKQLIFVPGGHERKSYFVPFGVERILILAFPSYQHLETVVIPPTVTKIENSNFNSNTLKSIVINQCKNLISFDFTPTSYQTSILHFNPYHCFYNNINITCNPSKTISYHLFYIFFTYQY